jgi:hypothetical protein
MTPPDIDPFLADFVRLIRAAASVMDEHVTDQHGRCASCGSAWPCEPAIVAEHNLAAF